MTDIRKWFIQRLRDAYDMEREAETTLAGHVQRIENYPAFAGRVRQHIEETKAQANRLAACLESVGENMSTSKTPRGSLAAATPELAGVVAGDEVVRAAIESHLFEHMEIASYRILIAAAEHFGNTDAMLACQANLQEEVAMAGWLDEQLPAITHAFLYGWAAGRKIKHA